MKVILNKDLSTLGEEGDVRDVARGYARNYLFPRGIALPYTPKTVKMFEARQAEIEARKVEKRQAALGLREKLESLELAITMPAGANGKLYGAVTSQTLADELVKNGFQIERKRIELAGNSIKSEGKYKAIVKLYENSQAEIQITVIGQAVKSESSASARPARRRREEAPPSDQEQIVDNTEASAPVQAAQDEAPAEAAGDSAATGQTGE